MESSISFAVIFMRYFDILKRLSGDLQELLTKGFESRKSRLKNIVMET